MGEPDTGDGAGSVRRTLESLCAAGVSGMLRVIGDPGGAIHLDRGRVVFAECPLSCDVQRLLTASGRLPAEVWRAAVAAGPDAIGDFLVGDGHVTAPELELTVLTATLDAALFLLDAPENGEFEANAPQPFHATRSFDYDELCAVIRDRRKELDGSWPQLEADMSPVSAVRRLPGQYVGLNAVQWELAVTADGARDPLELSHELGRGTYATLLEVQRLVAAGVLELRPRQRRERPPLRPNGPPAPAAASPSTPAPKPPPSMPPPPKPPPPKPPPPKPPPKPPPPKPTPAPESLPPPRRPPAADNLPTQPHRGVDTQAPWLNSRSHDLPAGSDFAESTLLKIRDALQALP